MIAQSLLQKQNLKRNSFKASLSVEKSMFLVSLRHNWSKRFVLSIHGITFFIQLNTNEIQIERASTDIWRLIVFMISWDVFPQSLSWRSLLVTMWTLMFQPWEMCLNMYSYVVLVLVSPITNVATPNSRARFIHNQTHGLSYKDIQVCNSLKFSSRRFVCATKGDVHKWANQC